MTSREYFDSLRSAVLELARMEDRLAALGISATSPKAQGQEPSARGSRSQPIEDRLIDMEREVDVARSRLEPELDHATHVLYGRSGRGGVARECGSAGADAVCGYYLMGLTWAQVASELMMPDSKDGAHWCRNRASAALARMDSVGMARLADS